MKVLSGGVSGDVVLMDDGRVRKQFLPKLKVPMEWLSDPRRVFREIDSLRAWGRIAGADIVPQILSVEPESFAYTMTYAEGPSWKDQLLGGEVRCSIARELGRRLALIHRKPDAEAARALMGQGFFYELRVDPYYETVRKRHPDLPIRTDFARVTLVHGDYSPKNILIHQEQLVLLDHEVIHFGDPAFDLGFALTHLLAKANHLPAMRGIFTEAAALFWRTYRETAAPLAQISGFENRAARHTLACLLARVDGRSPLEYLTSTERSRQREAALSLIGAEPATVTALIDSFVRLLG